ncbi:MAG TPA: hypothetical protein VK845_02380 [Gemmatimonadales bacterium]|nr:hypothetical protein [Gemmatimonadales bacterium]
MPAPSQQRSIHTELLFNLVFLASAAMMVVGVSTLMLSRLDPDRAFAAMLVLWAGGTAVFSGFGAYLVRHAVLDPLGRLRSLADRAAAGQPAGSAEPLGTREFDELSDRMQEMAEQLLQAHPSEGWRFDQDDSWVAQAGRGA